MAETFASLVTEALGNLRLDSASQTLAEGWANRVIQEVHGRHDWFWARERQVVQTVADKTDGTVDVTAGATAVVGTSTAFAAADVGKFIQFEGSNDWYKITAVTDTENLTIEPAYTQTASLDDGTFIIRKIFYSIPNARKVLSAKQALTKTEFVCMHYKEYQTYLEFSDSTGPGTSFCLYGIDSSNNLQMKLHPHPSEVYNIELLVKTKATQDSLTSVPEDYRKVYLDGVLTAGLEFIALGNPAQDMSKSIASKKADYERGIARMIAGAEPEEVYSPRLQNRDVPSVGVNWGTLPETV